MDDYRQRFERALESNDKDACVTMAIKWLEEGNMSVKDFYQHVLLDVLHSPTCTLENEDWCVWKDHLRTSILRTVVENCYPFVLSSKKLTVAGKKAMVVCPRGEQRELEASMMEDMFKMAGFDTVFIGRDTPQEEIASAVNYFKPTHVLIVVTTCYNLISAKNVVKQIRERGRPELNVLVSGRAFVHNPDCWKDLGADGVVDNFDDIQSFVGGV